MSVLERNEPTADVLMTSMRSMGYSFESAIADIIDNSIAANATSIELKFPIDPKDEFVAICDNGDGMSEAELYNAMKYGSRHNALERKESDLGRFGLGLKSASLSQCRILTVISKKNQAVSAYCWNLDKVEKEKEWSIIKYDADEIPDIRFSNYLDNKENGTVVLWEDFDFIKKSTGGVYSELSRLQESTANYISLIFHRFIRRDRNKIEFYSNNYKIEALDPFLENHPKTNERRIRTLKINDSNGIEREITVQPFILPFQKDLSNEDKKLSGGIENYRSKQGFYIYRNERLIIWGTWFGRHRDELTKYARIKVDIPNTLDDIWQIDIKKQSAKIPKVIQAQLKQAVDEAMDLAVKKEKHRGRIEKINDEIDYVWDRVQCRDNVFTYKINRESKVFDIIKGDMTDEQWTRLDMVLEEIENNIPYQQIYIDKSQNKVDEENDDERLADVLSKAEILIKWSTEQGGLEKEQAIENLMKAEPFNQYPQIKEMLKG